MLFDSIPKSQIVLLFVSFVCSLIYFFTLPFRPYSIDFVFKGLSILLIGIFAVTTLRNKTAIFLGLSFLCAVTGDVFLTFVDEKYFLLGLASFLVSHIFYIVTFSTLIQRPLFLDGFQKGTLVALALANIIIFMILRPYLNTFLLPVAVYGVFLTAMAMTAALIKANTKFILIGSVLFILSDSLIAVGKFIQPFFGEQHLVWLTYYAAQLFIPFGILRNKNSLT